MTKDNAKKTIVAARPPQKKALGYQMPDEWHTSVPCGADFNLGLLSRSPAKMRPAASQPNACVNP